MSGAASATIGAAIGGGVAYGTGGDIVSGAATGAMYGAGTRAATAVAGGASKALGVGMGVSIQNMMANLPKVQKIHGVSGARSLIRGTTSAMKGFNKAGGFLSGIGGIRAGVAGGAMSAGFATLASNQGRTFAQSSLNDRFRYQKSVREMQMNYNVQEAMMKKRIWQQNR